MTSVALPPATEVVAPSEAKRRSFAKVAETAWIWSVVGYTVLRFVVAWGAFSEHGANVWIFGLLDVGTAWPYAKAIAVVTRRAANAEWAKLPLPITIALASFFAPYAYLWFAAGAMPDGVRVAMAIFVTVVLVAATAGVLSKSRKLRREADEHVIDVSTSTSDDVVVVAGFESTQSGDVIDLRTAAHDTEMVIDLTGDDVSIERSAPSL